MLKSLNENNLNIILIFVVFISLTSCDLVKKGADLKELNKNANEKTLSMIGYQPIDPIQVSHVNNSKDTISLNSLLSNFPNEATRIAVGEITQNGSTSFGPFSIARTGRSYSVILDYIKYTTNSLSVTYSEARQPRKIGDSTYLRLEQRLQTAYGAVSGISNELIGKYNNGKHVDTTEFKNVKIKLPVYIGVGLRIQASITVLGDSVNLSSLYSIGAAASQHKLSGTLIIQTLGISGEDISPLMPLPDQINESTIQAAMQSLATIKSKIYNKDRIIISPQVVAFKLSFSIDKAKDLIEAALQSNPPEIVYMGKDKIIIRINDAVETQTISD
ncbi:hypothetical protein [Mucilaginibacter aquariorum]|uniref:Uncharacterized protein n=1 Tax=Mucilaginibacter aquariorum TaxID=2967225 RepID=A0ABT1T3R1_9SPHI|nr:hypothetical protein [Mucilaginibacter aquariorum]MCQ6958583.1 hypothetical protein [Mucilaginibacter aquariorum]